MPGIRGTFEERFWGKVIKTSRCWVWTGAKNKAGYGKLARGERSEGTVDSHRASWEIHNGPIQDGSIVLHKCDNPSCVRPEHLKLGSQRDNIQDMLKKERGNFPGAPGNENWKQVKNRLRGEKHPSSKLSDDQVREIQKLVKVHSLKEVADKFEVSKTQIWRIANRKQRRQS